MKEKALQKFTMGLMVFANLVQYLIITFFVHFALMLLGEKGMKPTNPNYDAISLLKGNSYCTFDNTSSKLSFFV